jgi:DinB superfamily
MMSTELRNQVLGEFGRGPILLSEALRRCPKKMWMYRPKRDRWSIHEIILHLADSEADNYIRCRQFIAQPGSAVLEYDPSNWAKSLGYFHQSTKDALGLIARLRRMTYHILSFVPESVWTHTVRHPKAGILSLDEWVEVQARHIPHHILQIEQNYNCWLEKNPPRKPPTRSERIEMDQTAPLAPAAEFAD